jgi:hypothetical protein
VVVETQSELVEQHVVPKEKSRYEQDFVELEELGEGNKIVSSLAIGKAPQICSLDKRKKNIFFESFFCFYTSRV